MSEAKRQSVFDALMEWACLTILVFGCAISADKDIIVGLVFAGAAAATIKGMR